MNITVIVRTAKHKDWLKYESVRLISSLILLDSALCLFAAFCLY
jgi:hypothetical protein